MRKLTFAAVLFAVTMQVQAESQEVPPICKTLETLAETVMERRQSGVRMSTMVEQLEGKGRELGKAMIMEAYDRPKYQVKENQQEAIDRFANEWYNFCVQSH